MGVGGFPGSFPPKRQGGDARADKKQSAEDNDLGQRLSGRIAEPEPLKQPDDVRRRDDIPMALTVGGAG